MSWKVAEDGLHGPWTHVGDSNHCDNLSCAISLSLSIFQIKKYIFKMKAWRYLEIIVLHIPFYILKVSHVLDHLWNNKIWSGESLKWYLMLLIETKKKCYMDKSHAFPRLLGPHELYQWASY